MVGLDISPGEVRHATARAESRAVANVKVAAFNLDPPFLGMFSLWPETWRRCPCLIQHLTLSSPTVHSVLLLTKRRPLKRSSGS